MLGLGRYRSGVPATSASALPAGEGGGVAAPPWWLRRQLDPASPAWRPGRAALANASGRSWTRIGLADAEGVWAVDPRGLAGPVGGCWSLDWWVGAEDRWHLPSADAAVRQRLVGATPVIETSIRVPGGDVVVRHWCRPEAGRAALVVEVANESAAPVAMALVLRPWHPSGVGRIDEVAVVAGRLVASASLPGAGAGALDAGASAGALGADRPPRQCALGRDGEVAATVLANAADAVGDRSRRADGDAAGALVWPLAHRSSLRATVTAGPTRPEGGVRGRHRGSPVGQRAAMAQPDPSGPDADQVARAWSVRAAQTTRIDLPDGALASAIGAQRLRLLLAAGPADEPSAVLDAGAHVPAGSAWGAGDPFVNRAEEVAALVDAGFGSDAAGILDGWLDGQRRNGTIGATPASTGAALWAIERWVAVADDPAPLLAAAPIAIARAAEATARGGPGVATAPADRLWRRAGLQAGARLLQRVGDPAASARVEGWAAAVHLDLLAPGEPDAAGGATPCTAARAVGAGLGEASVTALVGAAIGLIDAGSAAVSRARADLAAVRGGGDEGAVALGSPALGLSPRLSLLAAATGVRAGHGASAEIAWLASVGSPTWSWPALVHPTLGTGVAGDGDDRLVGAAWWWLTRSLLGAWPPPAAGDTPRITVAGWWPEDWLGREAEVHGLVTASGVLSWALRWHGERPALLWEVSGRGPDVEVRAPGLDPGWVGNGRRGDVLLAPVAARSAPRPGSLA